MQTRAVHRSQNQIPIQQYLQPTPDAQQIWSSLLLGTTTTTTTTTSSSSSSSIVLCLIQHHHHLQRHPYVLWHHRKRVQQPDNLLAVLALDGVQRCPDDSLLHAPGLPASAEFLLQQLHHAAPVAIKTDLLSQLPCHSDRQWQTVAKLNHCTRLFRHRHPISLPRCRQQHLDRLSFSRHSDFHNLRTDQQPTHT